MWGKPLWTCGTVPNDLVEAMSAADDRTAENENRMPPSAVERTDTKSFDSSSFLLALLDVNPWAKDAEIAEENADFLDRRRSACISRYREGMVVWNAWGQAMVALRRGLEEGGIWTVKDKTGYWAPRLALLRHGPLAAHAPAARPEAPHDLGADRQGRRPLAPQTAHPPPLAAPTLRRQTPEVGAVCGKAARTVLVQRS